MKKMKFQSVAGNCIESIRKIDFMTLGISEYNYQYIERLMPNLEYYFQIYSQSIELLIGNKKPEGYVVDFGGGHGFLSLYLQQLGFQVIYCDSNPLSVNTIQRIGLILGHDPDIVIEGSSAELLAYCRQHHVAVDYLIATDLIEHVYDLNRFFADLQDVNPALQMIFTTWVNPCNLPKVKRLRRMMKDVEANFFLPMRKEYIENHYAELTLGEIKQLAYRTRGRNYVDVTIAVEDYRKTGKLAMAIERFNTCDPQSGSWVERVLPLSEYRKVVEKNGFKVEFMKGFYNTNRHNPLLSFAVTLVNCMICYSGILGRVVSPYIILRVKPY
jgi:SAM-dependent methyltransferase